VKPGLCGGYLRHSHENCCNMAAVCKAVWGLGIMRCPSFWSSEEASWWSQIPNRCRTARSCVTVVLFTKPTIPCWKQTSFTDNTSWKMHELLWWLCGKVCHCSVFSGKMLLRIKCFWESKYSLCILTVWMTYIHIKIQQTSLCIYVYTTSIAQVQSLKEAS